MKRSVFLSLVTLAAASPASAEWPVIDLSNLEQALKQVELAQQQVTLIMETLKRMGDPAAVKQIIGAGQTLDQLARPGVGQSLLDLQLAATGQMGLAYDGFRLYRPVPPVVVLPDGKLVARPAEEYRKHEALQRAVTDFHAVTSDTQARREALRTAQSETTAQLQVATTDAEVQKLKGIQAAQASELNTITAEQSEAATRVLVQHAANEADKARQEQADLETRTASLQSALRGILRFFRADSKPALIPTPDDKVQ